MISPTQRPIRDNTQHSQATDLLWMHDQPDAETCAWQHTTLTSKRPPLDAWSAWRRDLCVTTHNTHKQQTSSGCMISPTQRPMRDNTQHSQATDILWMHDQPDAETYAWQHTTLTSNRHPLDAWSARRRVLCVTTHNTHKQQTSMPAAGFELTVSTIPAAADPPTN